MIKNYVDIPVGQAKQSSRSSFEPLRWAKQNCSSYITNDGVIIDGQYHCRFYFARERDQVAFALRWV